MNQEFEEHLELSGKQQFVIQVRSTRDVLIEFMEKKNIPHNIAVAAISQIMMAICKKDEVSNDTFYDLLLSIHKDYTDLGHWKE
jgi:hypothetical protein